MVDDAIVVTGMGALTPVGLTPQQTFDAALHAKSGVTSMDLGVGFDVRIGAMVKNFDSSQVLGPKQSRRQGRFANLAIAAASDALRDSGLSGADYHSDRIATIIGVGMGGIEALYDASVALHQHGPRKVSPFSVTALIPNMAAAAVAMLAGARGPSYCMASACASSLHAIGEGMRLLRCGEADVAIVGGAEACLNPLGVACFSRMGTLSRRNDDPTRASRPFDRDRDGFVVGEGAAVLVLESMGAARRRGARVYAELAGYGASCDSFHDTSPDPKGDGAARAMRSALQNARIAPDGVDYVNAHGTATRYNDIAETYAIRTALGSRAADVWISSTKGVMGHLLGASGSVETVIAILALRSGWVPPTANLDHPDAECGLDFVPNVAREGRIRIAMNNSFGFGGQNASVVLRKLE